MLDSGAGLALLLQTDSHPDLRLPEQVIPSNLGAGLGGILLLWPVVEPTQAFLVGCIALLVVLWTNEENGLRGGKAYAERHGPREGEAMNADGKVHVKNEIDRGIKVRTDGLYALMSWEELAYLIAPRLLLIGGLLLLANFSADYQRMLRKVAGDELELLELERSRFGVCHAELGALLLDLWNLPDDVVRAVEMHHVAVSRAQQPHGSAAYAVFMAETLLQDMQRGTDGSDEQSAAADLPSADQDKIASWRERCPELLNACGGA